MIYLKRAKAVVHYANYFRCLTRMAHCCFVKNAADSDRIDLSLEYAPKDGTVRTYNANRSKLEPLSNTLSRLGSRIEGQLNRKNKKRKRKEGDELTNTISSDQEMKLSICVMTCDSTKIIDEETPVVDAFTEKHVLVVDNEKVPIIVNPPCCTKIELPEVAMVGFPIFPSIQLEYVDHDHCEYRWKRIKYEDDVAIAEPSSKKKNKTDKPRTVIEATDLSDEIVYTPVISDIDRHLQLTCLPRTGERQGKAGIAVTKFEIKPGPGICPFDHRHLYTQKEAGPDELRVVSYNILADIYADQDFSRDVLFSYCPAYALAIDYRKPLLIKEIQGYKADLICLQEVDTKVFKNDLSTCLGLIGYQGFHMEKGDTKEGSAIFYRKSKFRLLEDQGEMILNILENNGICKDIVKKAYAVPKFKEALQTKKSVIHILVLEPIDQPGRILLVANTHLYFHPNAGHIRMVQVLVAMRYINTILQRYKSQNPTLIFCGDFNSTPSRAVYEFMTSKSVKEDNIDWNDGGQEQFIPEMNYSHSLNLASGCGLQPYTNYSDKFNGQLDYIFYDVDSFEVSQVIPQPDHRDVELNTAIPSIVFPSDHIAQVCDLKWKQ